MHAVTETKLTHLILSPGKQLSLLVQCKGEIAAAKNSCNLRGEIKWDFLGEFYIAFLLRIHLIWLVISEAKKLVVWVADETVVLSYENCGKTGKLFCDLNKVKFLLRFSIVSSPAINIIEFPVSCGALIFLFHSIK